MESNSKLQQKLGYINIIHSDRDNSITFYFRNNQTLFTAHCSNSIKPIQPSYIIYRIVYMCNPEYTYIKIVDIQAMAMITEYEQNVEVTNVELTAINKYS